MPRNHKVKTDVPQPDRDQLEAFAREKTRTVDECHEWLQARGYTIGRSAVGNWKQEFELEDKIRRAADLSRAYLSMGDAADTTKIASATLQKVQQLLFEFSLGADAAEAGDLLKLVLATKESMKLAGEIEDFRARQKEALAEADKAVKAGGSAGDVVAKVREILGIAA